MKKILVLIFAIVLVLSLLSVVSCKKRSSPNGPVDANDGTPTPEYSYQFYLYTQSTPQANTNIIMHSPTQVVPAQVIDATTDTNGAITFQNLHSKGIWLADVGASNNYLEANYNVDTTSTTFTAINRGRGSISLNLVSGTNNVPIIANQLIYQAVLTAPAPMTYTVTVLSDPSNILSSPAVVSYTVSTTNGLGTLVNNGDVATITLYFKDAETDYGTNFNIWVKAVSSAFTLTSPTQAVTKSWTASISAFTYTSITFTSTTSRGAGTEWDTSETYELYNFAPFITGSFVPSSLTPIIVGYGVSSGPAFLTSTVSVVSSVITITGQGPNHQSAESPPNQLSLWEPVPYVDVN